MFTVIVGGRSPEKRCITRDKSTRSKRGPELAAAPEVSYATYTVTYPELNARGYEKDHKGFELQVIHLYTRESCLGFKVAEISEPMLLGTRVTYEAIKGPKDFDDYMREVVEPLVEAYNNKYGESESFDCVM